MVSLEGGILLTRKVVVGTQVTSSGPYSHAVDSGDYVFFSGQTAYNALDYTGEKLDITEQTKKCFAHLQNVMDETELTFDDLVKVNVYLTSMQHFKAMNAVYEQAFAAPYPARTCVAVLELPLDADVEIECIAKKS